MTQSQQGKKFNLQSSHIYPLKKKKQWNLLENKKEKNIFGPQDLDLLFA